MATLIRDTQGFRQRGEQVTRLETFVDAAFAFAVTLLVVSFNAMPDSFTELYDALRRLPAFVGGFAILALFWTAHHRFSRRFGLEDGTVVFLSMALVAATLFYVYPLRMVMSAGMHFFTGGWAPSEFVVRSFLEFRLIFLIYGAGFAVLAGIMVWLNWHALRQAEALRLDAVEQTVTQSEIVSQLILMGTAMLSIALALLLPPDRGWMHALPGLAYALLGILMPWQAARAQRRVAMLLPQRDAMPTRTIA
ncbi:MAG: TMEM175 family protein [Luteimonas sp.]